MAAAAPAALVTLSLYAAMDRLIAVDEVAFSEAPERVLSTITPEERDEAVRPKGRDRPEAIDVNAPPPAPKIRSHDQNIDIPTVAYTGAAPTQLSFERLTTIAVPPPAIGNRDLVVIRPPVPDYPRRAMERGLEGACEVDFDVDARGRPFNVSASCSDPVFVRAAETAVSKAEFAPRIIDDQPVERRNVLYPLAFKLS